MAVIVVGLVAHQGLVGGVCHDDQAGPFCCVRTHDAVDISVRIYRRRTVPRSKDGAALLAGPRCMGR
jgi:hypothetical protein